MWLSSWWQVLMSQRMLLRGRRHIHLLFAHSQELTDVACDHNSNAHEDIDHQVRPRTQDDEDGFVADLIIFFHQGLHVDKKVGEAGECKDQAQEEYGRKHLHPATLVREEARRLLTVIVEYREVTDILKRFNDYKRNPFVVVLNDYVVHYYR